MSLPKFSVVTASFNHGEFLRQNIESVLAQDYDNFEHIIIDGGSTDNTLDILRSYPHINWISEPDRGQSDALNKGFEKASGDIIAWLNSDDWYPPKIFEEIARELEDSSIVLGACQMTDKDGNPDIMVPNLERGWYDILKYWVFYSSPAQPSIFFTRELFDKCRLENGKIIDEDLDFTMDYEFWLRLTKHAEMRKRSSSVWSYYRNYDTNKTGQSMDAVYREFSSVYRRHSKNRCMTERCLCFLLPLDGPSQDLEQYIMQVGSQSYLDSEILVIDYAVESEHSKKLRKQVLSLAGSFSPGALRVVRADKKNKLEALQQGFQSARSDLVAYLPIETQLGTDFSLKVFHTFNQDNLALLVPSCGDKFLLSQLTKETELGRRFSYDLLFGIDYLLPPFIARNIALKEVDGFRRYAGELSALLSFRELALEFIFRGWQIQVDSTLSIQAPTRFLQDESELAVVFQSYINSQIILGLTEQLSHDAFARLRVQNGFGLAFNESLAQAARKLISSAPRNWMLISRAMQEEQLESITSQHSRFSPAFYMLAHYYQKAGNTEKLAQCQAQFDRAREFEGSL